MYLLESGGQFVCQKKTPKTLQNRPLCSICRWCSPTPPLRQAPQSWFWSSSCGRGPLHPFSSISRCASATMCCFAHLPVSCPTHTAQRTRDPSTRKRVSHTGLLAALGYEESQWRGWWCPEASAQLPRGPMVWYSGTRCIYGLDWQGTHRPSYTEHSTISFCSPSNSRLPFFTMWPNPPPSPPSLAWASATNL